MKISDKIKLVKLGDIKPYKRNAKLHPPEQIEAIKKSIERSSYLQPIVIDGNNEIIIGHGRYEAMQQLYGLNAEIECVAADNLTENEVRALRIFDNKVAETGWDFTKLDEDVKSLLDDMPAEEVSVITGVETKYLESMDIDLSEYQRGMEGPEIDKIVDEFEAAEPNKGKSQKNENWFYIEFYEDPERFEEINALLEEYKINNSPHEIDRDLFFKAIIAYLK